MVAAALVIGVYEGAAAISSGIISAGSEVAAGEYSYAWVAFTEGLAQHTVAGEIIGTLARLY